MAYAYAMEEAGRVVRDPLVGSVLHERYRLLRRIGRGGMGIVYLAEHVLIGRKYAIKVLSERANATDEMVARFHREAMAAAAVGSDHVVEVTDMGQLEDGSYFIVLEYLEGEELAKLVLSSGVLDAGRAVKIVCQLCDALSAVHEKGIVHRDLKPENLFLIEHHGQRDFLKVLDFGVCKLIEGSAERAADLPVLTRTNASLGTPQYMAPEQFHASARVDHRADIHAAGAVLYFTLTGKPPFDAPSLAQLAMRACVEPPPTLLAQRPELPAGLDAVIQRAMAKHPEDRFASSALLKQALLPFAELRIAASVLPTTLPGPGSSTYPTQPAETPYDAALREKSTSAAYALPQRRWPITLAAAALVMGLLSAMVWGAWALSRAEARPRAAAVPSSASAASSAPIPSPETVAARPAATLPTSVEAASAAPRGASSLKSASRPGGSGPKRAAEPAKAASSEVPRLSPVESVAPVPEPALSKPRGDATYHFPKRALKDVF